MSFILYVSRKNGIVSFITDLNIFKAVLPFFVKPTLNLYLCFAVHSSCVKSRVKLCPTLNKKITPKGDLKGDFQRRILIIHLFRVILFLKKNNSKNGIIIKNPYP